MLNANRELGYTRQASIVLSPSREGTFVPMRVTNSTALHILSSPHSLPA